MSVILQLNDWTATQGQSAFYLQTITNSGNERVKDIQLKVIDTVVFDNFKIASHPYNVIVSCLNTFVLLYAGTIDAEATRDFHAIPAVKAAAPIQVHSIQCEFKYSVY